MGSVVCVFAHPDDEAFGPAGTIAKFAKDNDVYVLCVTKGNFVKSKDPEKLGVIREKELEESAKILGVKKVDFLGFDDGCLCNNLYHELANAIEDKLKEYKPHTIMTFDIKGVSGHLDHITVSLITTYVFWRAPFVKRLLYYCEMKDVLDNIHDYFIYIPPGYKEADVDLTIDISPFWEMKKKAINAHVSQKKDRDMFLGLYTNLDRKEEHFFEVKK